MSENLVGGYQRLRRQRPRGEAVHVLLMLGEHRVHRLVIAHRGVSAVRVNRVDPDSVLAEFDRQRVDQPDDPELGCAVVPASGYGLDACRGTDEDDRSAVARFDHGGNGGFDGVPYTGEVDVDGVLPLTLRNLP